MINKRGQEEMVGFALILIIVAVIFLVLLSTYVRKSPESGAGNPEVNSFIQAALQYTTTCELDSENLTLQRLIIKCQSGEVCDNGKSTCKVRNDTIKYLAENSWNVGEDNPVKGYNILIFTEDEQLLNKTEGVVTKNYKGSIQDLPDQELITIVFTAYS